jgi:hypothetical protein
MTESRNLANDRLQQERDRLNQRQKQLEIMQKLIDGLTEEQLEAMIALSDVCQGAARQRQMAMQQQAGMMRGPMGAPFGGRLDLQRHAEV